jgi:PAS domain S-box-containing protein
MLGVVAPASTRGPSPRVQTIFGLVALLLLALGGVTWWNTSRLVDAALRVEHTRSVMADLDFLFLSLKDAESSQSGYLITGLPSYLEPYQTAEASFGPTLDRLHQLVADNREQERNLQRLAQLVSERRAILKENIDLRDRNGIEAAAAAIASGAGKEKMDEIRALIGRMQSNERLLLHERSTNTASLARVAIVTVALGAVVFFGLLVAIWTLIRRDLAHRDAAEEKLRTTLRSIGDAVIATDAKGRVTFLNPVAERLTGWAAPDADGRDASEIFRIVNETTRAEVESPIRRVLREGAIVGLANHTTLIGRTGEEYPIADSGAPIRGDRGEINGVVLVFRDITETRRTEQDLQRLAAIVASSEDAIVGEDLDGTVTAWNASAERLFGYSAAEMVGRSTALLEPVELEGNTQGILAKIRSGERVLQFDSLRKRKDGTTVPVSVSISPILGDEGRVIGASKIARDITERKQAEMALRAAKESAETANRAKDRFLAVLSHELRTPLTPALATAQILERRAGLPEDLAKALRLIRRNIELEALLVDDLLDLTRIAHGKIELRREPVDLHAAIESVAEICRSDSYARRQSLTFDLRAGEHHAEADSARLQQVLWNLLKNAIKFTGDGGRIEMATDNPNPGVVRIRVIDTGIGLSPHLLDRIFEPFEQATQGESTRYGGLGLGLSISRTLVELHGGAIRAESAGEGKGTTFVVELPAHLEKRVAQPDRPTGGVRVTRPPLAILVVEDHADTAASLAQLLESEGHSVRTAASVAEAEALFRDGPCDLLITDLGLPDASGHELLGRLRQVRPVPAIVLSGYGMDSDVAASRAAGFLEHLTKPINIRRLLHVIDRVSQAGPAL